MRLIFIFFTLFFLHNHTFAQKKKDYFESLDTEIRNCFQDKFKIKTIVDRETVKYNETGKKKYLLSSKYSKLFLRNPNDINLLSENYEIYSHNIQEFPFLYIKILYNLSLIFSNNNLPDKATYYIDMAIKEAKKQNYILYLAYLYHGKGNIFSEKKDYKNSTMFFLEALKIYKKAEDTTNIASINTGIGENFFKEGNYSKAYEYFQVALKTIDSKKNLSQYDQYILGGVKQNLGRKYAKIGDFENAEKSFKETLDIFKNNPKYELEFIHSITELSNLYADYAKTEKNNQFIAYMKAIEPKLTGTRNRITIADLLLKHYFNINNKTETQYYINKLIDINLQNQKEWGEENKKITEILNKKIIDGIENEIEYQRKKNFWVITTSLLTAIIFVILSISLRNKRKREKLFFEKQKLIDEQNKIIMEHNMKVQDEKIKNLHLNLNLKNQTEKAFLQKIKTIRKSSKNTDDMMKELYFNLHNLLQIDKKNSNFSEESYLQNRLFIENLSARFPDLNDNELRLCIYFKLNLTPKEIAIIENTTNGNIRVKKNKIKSKMGLSAIDNLDEFIRRM